MRPDARAHHRHDRRAGERDRALEVHRELLVEVLVLETEEQLVDRDAGVGDDDVEAPLVLGDLLHRGLGGLGVGDVEADRLGLAAGGGDRLAGLARGGLALGVVDEHLGARLGERDARSRDRCRANHR